VAELRRRWADPAFHHEDMIDRLNPEAPEDERSAFLRVFRLSVSPGAAAEYMRVNVDVDVRDVLPLISVPTLVLHRSGVNTPPIHLTACRQPGEVRSPDETRCRVQ
jgi:hypothetical protein